MNLLRATDGADSSKPALDAARQVCRAQDGHETVEAREFDRQLGRPPTVGRDERHVLAGARVVSS
ncbi:hypothetical protein L6V77_18155 [Myxococcota bacterium]|nr:hypothetical protein [Myxococcota bacterium]